MNIQDYYQLDGEALCFTRAQASRFAKGVAGDFNPIHDEDAKKFCVPGDLLFAVLLSRYGVSNHTRFEFAGMVTESSRPLLPAEIDGEVQIADAEGKAFLNVAMAGERCTDEAFVSALSEQYVRFSGQTFPHILVGLMRDNGVMINPSRPLVMYRSMAIELDRFAAESLELTLSNASLTSEGKKGEVTLAFDIKSAGELIGRGTKEMLIGGLREYDQAQMDEVVASYDSWKQAFNA